MYYSPNRALRGRSTYRNITYMRYIALRVPAPKELRYYGFTSNPNESPKINFNHTINDVSTQTSSYNLNPGRYDDQSLLSFQPKNLSVHNLCQTIKPPPGKNNPLGLGLKYCIAPLNPIPTSNNAYSKWPTKSGINIVYSKNLQILLTATSLSCTSN
jgi:hypothetical protein